LSPAAQMGLEAQAAKAMSEGNYTRLAQLAKQLQATKERA
jgi:hypothetical protein